MCYIPQQKHAQWELREDMVWLEFKHNRRHERFLRWLVKKPNISHVELDYLGSNVWRLIDGQRSISDIVERMIGFDNDTLASMQQRVIVFLRYLSARGWIHYRKSG